MHKFALFSLLLLLLPSISLHARDKELIEQIADIKEMVEQEKTINSELKAELATRETEVTELKLKLKEIEDMIAAFRLKHNLG